MSPPYTNLKDLGLIEGREDVPNIIHDLTALGVDRKALIQRHAKSSHRNDIEHVRDTPLPHLQHPQDGHDRTGYYKHLSQKYLCSTRECISVSVPPLTLSGCFVVQVHLISLPLSVTFPRM